MGKHKESKFSHIKPVKTGTMYGIPVVIKMVQDEVKQAIELLSVPGAEMQRNSAVNKSILIMPGNKPFELREKFCDAIQEWCSEDKTVFIAPGIRVFKIKEGALKHILFYE